MSFKLPTFPKLPYHSEVKKESESTDNFLALDIGTEFIKCILAVPEKLSKKSSSGKLEILGVSKVRQAPGNMKDGTIKSISGVVDSCESALSELENKTGVRAKQVIIGLSGEQIKGRTSTIRYRRDTPSKNITDAELRELLEKIESRAKSKIKDELSLETDGAEAHPSLINSAVVSISIDGYKVNNPVGFKGSEVLIEYYTAFAPEISVSALEKICAELELDLVAVVAEPFAICRACLGDDVDIDFTGILIDIGSGTTDIAVVDSGDICGTKTFNIAGSSFTKQISDSLNLKPALAEKCKLSLDDDSKLSDSSINKINAALSRSLPVWLAGVSVALEDFKNIEPLPSDIYLCGGSANLLPLEEALATTDWYQDLPFERRPLVHLIDPFSLPDFTFPESFEESGELDLSFVTALGLLRVAVDTVLASPEKTNLRAKLSKLLSH